MKVIILDRDGVINVDSANYIKSPEEFHPMPDSLKAITNLYRKGYRLIVATNQSGIARGYYDEKTLEKIHQKLHREVENAGGKIDRIYFCPHNAEDNCDCRKPKPGLLKQIEKDYSIDLSQTYFIGDKYDDYLAAQAAGCRFILVKSGYGKAMLDAHPKLHHLLIAENLLDAEKQFF